jgi:hypothetical protein
MKLAEITQNDFRPNFREQYSNKALDQMLLADWNQEYQTASINYPAIWKFKDSSANGLTRCKVTYVSLNDGFAVRICNRDVNGSKNRKNRTRNSRKKLSNVLSTYRAQFIDIDIETDIQRLIEKEGMSDHEIIRVNFILVRTFMEFKNWFDTI